MANGHEQLDGFQGCVAEKLIADDLDRSPSPRPLPASDRFEFGQHLVEASRRIHGNMIRIKREAVSCVERCGRAIDQYGAGNDPLRPSGRKGTTSQSGQVSLGIAHPKVVAPGVPIGHVHPADAKSFCPDPISASPKLERASPS